MTNLVENKLSPTYLPDMRDKVRAAKRKAILFCHMHKTGGKTIENVLSENYTEDTYRVSTVNDVDAFIRKIEDGEFDAEKTYLVYGHRAYVVYDRLAEVIPTFAFTIFRRPLPLFESNFSFQHTRHAKTSLTTEEYFSRYPKNKIMDYFSFDGFENAVSELYNKFIFIGLTERMAENTAILTYLLDLKEQAYGSKNITSPTDYVEIDFEYTLPFLRDNAEDCLLFDYAETIHSRLYRQLLKQEDAPQTEVTKSERSFNKPTGTNLDIENNNDKVSLFLSGKNLWNKDRSMALTFFDKSFSIDWQMAKRINNFMKEVDIEAANDWMDAKADILRADGGDTATKFLKRIENWKNGAE